MTEGNFVDYVKLHIKSGSGGKGSNHLHREKYNSKGGPDGGDGGRGGHIIIRGNENLWTLYNFKFKRHFVAGNGENGSKKRSSGAQGKDLIIDVPLGTVIKNKRNNEILFEITKSNQEIIVLRGGLGGLGNWNFKSSVRQTPRYAQSGQGSNELDIILELKILADVGLVGFPNAGKSTLLKAITGAKPKIGEYEFTTLKPNLGIVPYRSFQSFVVADIPGIIEGASKGKGLGYNFLRHIERNSILLYVIPLDSKDVKKDFDILINELKQYNSDLLDKDYAVVLSKSDLLDDELLHEYYSDLKIHFRDIPYFIISSIQKKGLVELKDGVWKLLNKSENV
ncbi:MAG: GTPase ObgE [Flavobacteriaceae bacterium]|nr:GTPase ObgE [Flavobacteriaceae bacterium]|tara:strand:- start:28261 stop:29274 length:1014 start_codon:yes stop_codon:yes gene_type:complete